MKNGIETRSNGVRIFKIQGNVIPLYYVEGSKNGPWDYLYNARTDADKLAMPIKAYKGYLIKDKQTQKIAVLAGPPTPGYKAARNELVKDYEWVEVEVTYTPTGTVIVDGVIIKGAS